MSDEKKKPFYITTTLPYVNSDPHIGFAMEIIRADALARYKKLVGHDVFFNTGTDEHGQKIYQRALEAGRDTQEYVDEYAEKFKGLKQSLGLMDELHFIRTTDKNHIEAAQKFWNICSEKGYIYKKQFTGLYCVGCEMFVTEKDLINGECPDHPGKKPLTTEEENYFFKFSEFEKPLLDFYEKNPTFVEPDFRFNEIKAFVTGGLQDFSISRMKERMPWGVPVPNDEAHVMYVWFDALVNYISTLGWPEVSGDFSTFWLHGDTVQVCGKDNLRQQSAMWQAMLMAAGIPNTGKVLINGFINSGGQKMSKSIGNVINPYDIVEEYGTDAIRYYVLRELSSNEDSDITIEKFKESYNGNLANGLGNLVSRIMKMAETHLESTPAIPERSIPDEFLHAMDAFDYNKAMNITWRHIGELDQIIADKKPFSLIKEDREAAILILQDLVVRLYTIGRMLNPLLPETSRKIKEAVMQNKKPEESLFMRKE